MASVEQAISITKDNLYKVFGTLSHEERIQNLARLWHPNGIFIDPQDVATTHEGISATVAKLQNAEWVFSELGPVDVAAPAGSDIVVARLKWGYGKPGEKPEVTGLDVVSVREGKVERLYTFLDSAP
ncbi:hypothetical protein Dda_2495 [Drechslerella dactyloides]|uniref:SnoaL-like domain-containing protein n=1 Tax=Drechslerella dactyloides TaxID=74499 RepID=A0AAD6NKN4_DREDA|nr:hypothetical protein Dda_2495 [Drechslerella dactyloides]